VRYGNKYDKLTKGEGHIVMKYDIQLFQTNKKEGGEGGSTAGGKDMWAYARKVTPPCKVHTIFKVSEADWPLSPRRCQGKRKWLCQKVKAISEENKKRIYC
jgi:hypothetical protein